MFGQVAGADNQAAAQVAPNEQFFDEEAGHNGFARAGVIGQQKAEGLAGQHVVVHGGNLVGQRLHQRGVNRQVGVKQVSQTDALGFGHQAQQAAIGLKTPGATLSHQLQSRLLLPKEQLMVRLAGSVFVGQLDHVAAVPLNINNRSQAGGHQAPDRRAAIQVFESGHPIESFG